MTQRKPPAQRQATQKVPALSPNKGPKRPLCLSSIKPIVKSGPEPSNSTEPSKPSDEENSVLIVLGYDDHAKPRAARFTGGDPAMIEKAAAAMNLEVRPANSTDLAKLAKRLPEGHLYANGTGFVPNVRQTLYTEIIAAMVAKADADRNNSFPPPVA